MTVGLKGETAEKMTAQAVSDFLAQAKPGTRVRVCCGEGGHFTLYGERIASAKLRSREPKSIQAARLLSGCILAQEGGSWFVYEKGRRRNKRESLFSIIESG